jgi:Ca2+ transporting ATPase
MDSLGSLALATEPPYNELLERKPTNKNESIINGRMWKHIVLQSIFEIGILLFFYLEAPKYIDEYKPNLLKLASDIKACTGGLPGGAKDIKKILYGTKEDWSENYYFDLSREYCKEDNSSCINITNNDCIRFDKKYNLPKNELDISIFNKTITIENTTYYLSNNSYFPFSLNDYYSHYISDFGGTTHMTIIFDIFVIYTLFNQVNCRIIDDSFNTFKRINKGLLFCVVTLIELAIQLLLSQFGRIVFHCVNDGLAKWQWLIVFAFALSTMVFNFIIKLIPLEKVIDPFTKGPSQQTAEKARTTINEMVNQNLKD